MTSCSWNTSILVRKDLEIFESMQVGKLRYQVGYQCLKTLSCGGQNHVLPQLYHTGSVFWDQAHISSLVQLMVKSNEYFSLSSI